MNHQKITGIILALLGSAFFGMIPLFTIPLLSAGASPQTVLTYRYFIATLAMALILVIRKEKFLLSCKDAIKIALLGTAYFLTVLCYTWSLNYLPGGIAATIQFLYPVIVIVIKAIFFHRHFHWPTIAAASLAVVGVAVLSWEPPSALTSGSDMLIGIALALLTGFFNAIYLVGVQMARIPHVDGFVLTFYMMGFGFVYCFGAGMVAGSLQWLGEPALLLTAFFLAIITAVLSNLALILAVRRIGASLASILGVMEPLTAVALGALVFDEAITPGIALGIIMVNAAVLLAICAPKLMPEGH